MPQRRTIFAVSGAALAVAAIAASATYAYAQSFTPSAQSNRCATAVGRLTIQQCRGSDCTVLAGRAFRVGEEEGNGYVAVYHRVGEGYALRSQLNLDVDQSYCWAAGI